MRNKLIKLLIILSAVNMSIACAAANDEYSAGMYKVGVDIPEGEYLLMASGGSGYFCVSSDSNQNDIIFNENFEYNSIVTIEDGEYLDLSRCYAVPFSEGTDISTGETGCMLKVGTHISAGEYKLIATEEDGYYCIYKTSRQDDIVANDNFEGQKYITVTDGQYLVLNRCYIDSLNDNLNNSNDVDNEKLKEALTSELEEIFATYNIAFKDDSVAKKFSEKDIPMPESIITGFPEYKIEDGYYTYIFNDSQAAKAYQAAYMVYLMINDYDVEVMDGEPYWIINDTVYVCEGSYDDNGDKYALAIVFL